MVRQVTAIRAGKSRRKRVSVFLDGRFAFSLETEVAVKEGLHVGRELTESQIEELTGSDYLQRCYNAAVHYLGYRPRSESEVRERLKRRGFEGSAVEATIDRLREQGLMDDVAFAQFWKDNRESFSPRSQWLTRLELRRKGVADAVIDEVIGAIDDTDNAYRAALEKARSLSRSDYQQFRRRLGGYLKRRGFNYGVIAAAVERVWQEAQGEVGSHGAGYRRD